MTCLIKTFPGYDDIAKAFSNIKLPSLPTFPKPFFGADSGSSVNSPTIVLQHWIAEIQNLFYGGMIMSVLKAIANLLSLDLSKIIPKIPGLGDVSIVDFISGNYTKIKNAIFSATKNKDSSVTSIFPQMFGAIHMIGVEIAHMIQTIFTMAIQTIVGIVVSLVKPVIDFIAAIGPVIAGIKIPTIPSLSDIRNKLASSDKKSTSITFPGFPAITLPSFGPIVAPVMVMIKAMPMILMSMIIEVIKPISKFIDDISSFIGGFKWPKCCVNQSGFYPG